MTKTPHLSRMALLCGLTCALLLAYGVTANPAQAKASAKAAATKPAAKSSEQKAPEKETAAGEQVSVAKDGASIHSGPDAKKEILWTVFKGYPLQVLSREGKWAHVVDFDGDKGWILTSLLSKHKTVIVKATTANMRVGSGKDYEIVAEVKHGVVFKPLETEGDWIKVKHTDGTTGWILSKLLWPNQTQTP